MLRSLSRLWRRFPTPTLPQELRCRPRLEALEDRLAPAFDLTISTAPTSALGIVALVLTGNVATFTAIGSGANVDVDYIRAYLENDFDVVISSGTTGAQDGDINWLFGADLITDDILNPQSLTLATDVSSVSGDITISSSIYNTNDGDRNLALTLTAAGATRNILSNGVLDDLREFSATTSGPGVITTGQTRTDDDITFTGDTSLNAYLISQRGGDITITGNLTLLDNVLLRTQSYYGEGVGDVTISGTIEGTSEDELDIESFGAAVTLGGVVGAGGEISILDIQADDISISNNIFINDPLFGRIFLNGDVTTAGDRVFDLTGAPSGVVFFAGIAAAATLGGDLTVNFADPNHQLQFASDLIAGNNDVTTNGSVLINGTFSGTTLSAEEVQVASNGRVAPGGIGGDGNLTITVTTSVNFEADSVLLIDLDAVPDQLIVIGDVSIDAEARIDGGGSLPAAGSFTIVTATTLTGEFQGTVGGQTFVMGNDAVTASYPGTLMSVSQAAGGPNTVLAADPISGAIYTVKLTGGGAAELVVVDNPDTIDIDAIFVRNSTANHTLTVTVNPNGGPPLISVAALRVDGSLGLFSAPNVILFGDHNVGGYLKSATVLNLIGTLTTGGTASQKTTLKGNLFEADLTLGSKLNLLSGKDFFGSITAPTIGKILMTAGNGQDGDFRADLTLDAGSTTATALATASIAGDVEGTWDIRGKIGSVTVKGFADEWQVGTTGGGFAHPDQLGGINKLVVSNGVLESSLHTIGRLATLTVGEWFFSDITADSIGAIKVTGNSTGLGGNWLLSDVTVTGSVNPGQVALKSFSAKGSVIDSTFDIQDGNVTSFVAGRFISSNLYVGLSSGGSLTSGTFVGNFRLGTFRTTAVPLNPPTVDPATVAFADSEVCASRFGTVRLSSVAIDNGGTVFGLRVAAAANAGSVRIATAPFPAGNLPTGTDEVDFEFLASA